MIAVKKNKEYEISEIEKNSYKKNGYDIYDNQGNLLEYSDKKTVPYAEFAKLKAELATKDGANDEKIVKILKEYADYNHINIGSSHTVDGILKKIGD